MINKKMHNTAITIFLAMLLSACSGIFMTDNMPSKESKNQMPPTATKGVDDLAFGEYHIEFNALHGLNIIHDKQYGLIVRAYHLDNDSDSVLVHSTFVNPLAVSVGKNETGLSRAVYYIQFDDSKRMWVFDNEKNPIPCHPYKACRYNLLGGQVERSGFGALK